MGKRGLGRGLDALISVDYKDGDSHPIQVEIGKVIRRAGQPRKTFTEESLRELAESVREHGLLQPILVRPIDNERYEVIAGERRLRAAEIAGLENIPVVVKDMGDREASEIALVENLQREDLNPVEEAMAYRQMIEQYNYTQDVLAQRIGKSRSHVANTLRILNLAEEVIAMIERGELSAGHARAILSVGHDKEEQVRLARKIFSRGLSVREAERVSDRRRKEKRSVKAPEIAELEERLEHRLGTRTNLVRKKRGGKIEIFFYNDEDLERILDILEI